MRGAHHGRARVGDGRHAGLAEQADVVALQRGREQRPSRRSRLSWSPFLWTSRGSSTICCSLQRRASGVHLVDALEVGARRLGVLADPVRQAGRGRAACRRAARRPAAPAPRSRNPAARGPGRACRCAAITAPSTPAARSMRQVRISGRPTRAVGSSLSIASSRAMPRPSLLGAAGAVVGLLGAQVALDLGVAQLRGSARAPAPGPLARSRSPGRPRPRRSGTPRCWPRMRRSWATARSWCRACPAVRRPGRPPGRSRSPRPREIARPPRCALASASRSASACGRFAGPRRLVDVGQLRPRKAGAGATAARGGSARSSRARAAGLRRGWQDRARHGADSLTLAPMSKRVRPRAGWM